jgi:HPt (histidine-containing phosphotransfer) domain-containing protein
MFATLARWIRPLAADAAVAPGAAEGEACGDPLAALSGIDSRAGVAAMMGDSTLYIHLLRMFRDRERNFVERFRAARARGDAATAMRMAHDLKSVSGSLAVPAVNQAAVALERACLDGAVDDRIESLLQDVERPLGPVIAELNAL